MRKFAFLLLAIAITWGSCSILFPTKRDIKVLVFSKTESFRHASIPNGIKAIRDLSIKHEFTVDTTEDASIFKEETLKKYNVVVFLHTTGDILNEAQQLEFNRWIQSGGGFVGIHAAADTEYDWPWYGELVGAYFNGHPVEPNVRDAVVRRIDKGHESSAMLPDDWACKDEWYNYKNLNPNVTVLLNLDESTYEGGTNGEKHPIAWYHEFDGGRSWYTGLGHTAESFEDPLYLEHLWGGISYAAGAGVPVDYNRSTVAPEENRFVKKVLADNLFEPTELELLPNGDLLFTQRRGELMLYEADLEDTRIVHKLNVHTEHEDGLMGIALDPNFKENNWIYLYYSPAGEEAKQHLSRFEYKNGVLDTLSEIVVLEVKTQREECCHTGGSIEFGPDGLLFLSTGDNTNPFNSDGFSPSDEQADRAPWDAQGSSANANDLRGKVLRIKPLADGTYEIPEGNLFPEGTADTRPEIYVMGCRNPYRIAIDQRTKYLYWGDVGPDAGKDSLGRGPRGYDEVNQARQAGFFGWPYFIGNNYAYNKYDFKTKKSSDPNNPKAPQNTSPNNTGINTLPPAQPAYIWYPYAESPDFPLVGDGGRNAMAAGVYYYDDYAETDKRYPSYYNGKLFTYDWMRGWFMAVTMDEEGDLTKMERFLPSMKFNNPMDVLFSPKGDMYMLEYGTLWFEQNPDARLVHLKYIAGNRAPAAKIETEVIAGAAPLAINFKGGASKDPDGDEITFEWSFDSEEVQSTAADPVHTFDKPGEYEVSLTTTDAEGETATVKQTILVGNEVPTVDWKVAGNTSFFSDNQVVNYEILVKDDEDGSVGNGIDPNRINVSIDYLERGSDITEIAQGHQAMLEASNFFLGKKLMDNSDCVTCHQLEKKSIGPSYKDIALKYKTDIKAVDYLAGRIINGGGGVWGDQAMAAHPQLTQNESKQMVRYILSLEGWQGEKKGLPYKGSYVLKDHIGKEAGGVYMMTASYTDKGGKVIGPLTARKMLQLRSPKMPAVNFTTIEKAAKMKLEPGQVPGVEEELNFIIGNKNGYVSYKDIGFTGVQAIDLTIMQAATYFGGGAIELRIDAPDGPVIGAVDVVQGLTDMGADVLNVAIEKTEGTHDLYVFFDSKGNEKPVCTLLTLEFKMGAVQ